MDAVAYVIGAIIFCYGLVLGSFYNVLIYRIPRELPFGRGRSRCPLCHEELKARDLIPLVSQILLKSRCRYCGGRISFRYGLVELAAGLLFLLAYGLGGLSWLTLLRLLLWSMLLITALMDYDSMLISDGVLGVFTALAVLPVLFMGNVKSHILGLLFGFAFYYTIYFVTKMIYKREVFGLGDVLLMGAAGFFLGFGKGVMASFFSFYTALLGIILLAAVGKIKNRRQEIPFGPFICAAVFFTDIFGQSLLDAYFSFLN